MASIDLKPLVDRLSEPGRRILEAAAGLTVSRTHYNIEYEHLLHALVDRADTDAAAILRYFNIDAGALQHRLDRMLDFMKVGNVRAPSLSPDVIAILTQAWLLASLEHGATRIRTGHLLWGMVTAEGLESRAQVVSPELSTIKIGLLKTQYADICQHSREAVDAGPAAPPPPTAEPGSGEGLDRFTTDMTAAARAGSIDPVIGRDGEIRQLIDILSRRRQNNPILTGEAGVGKTAVVEGLARRIADGDVPASLKGVALRSLDLGLLQAGAGVKGEFENRLRSVIDQVAASAGGVILFIDEAHMLVGAGGAAGQGDAANLLKPALARGALRMVGATTWAEYKKYFEKDAALTRRFQVVVVDEPSEPVAEAMIRGTVSRLELHHGVRILDEAVTEAVRLSARYIPSRQLPDKAVSLIDTACARVGMMQAATPAAVEDSRRRIELIGTEMAIIEREESEGANHAARREALEVERVSITGRLVELEARWTDERNQVAEIGTIRAALEQGGDDRHALRKQLAEANVRLRATQGEESLVSPVVDGQSVAAIVESWTGIPAGRMRSDEIRTVLGLRSAMERRVIGQPDALEAVARAIHTSRAKLTDPRKPVGVFLMVGTSGVGKTETALTLAELLFGGEQNLTTINMNEFKEEHKVSLLMGSPPGYVGYGEGGILTEAVRRRPYSVILLDEMEKAHPGVQDVFFQVFDKGNMKDGEGREIDFRNTVIIMTSNAGTDLIARLFAQGTPDTSQLAAALRPELDRWFKPAFLGRVTLVPYLPLPQSIIRDIVTMQLRRIQLRVMDAYRAEFDWDPALVDHVTARCTESASGARAVETLLSRTLLPELSAEILGRLAEGRVIGRVQVNLVDGEFCYDIAPAEAPRLSADQDAAQA